MTAIELNEIVAFPEGFPAVTTGVLLLETRALFCESHLWGKNLVDYFKKVYYSRSKYCIMFVSKEYISKMWPIHERKCATARDIEEFGEYILPVVFERVEVPGLDPAKKYLSAKKYSPKRIANMFIEKYEANRN